MMMSDIEEIKKRQKDKAEEKCRIPLAYCNESNGWYTKYWCVC